MFARVRQIRLSKTLRPCRSFSRTCIVRNDEYEQFFKYTSGRWIDDEEKHMAQHYRRFDVDALKKVAVEAADASNVLRMVKLFENHFYKTFEITMDNKQTVIARIPTMLIGNTSLAVASEVATMDFARSRLDVPVPEVLSWCADASSTAVGAEYIITKNGKGLELGRVWAELSDQLKDNVISAIVDIQKRMVIPELTGGYGSIYYGGSIGPSEAKNFLTDGKLEELYVLGPCTHPEWWLEERAKMDNISRGPWLDTLSYINAISDRERNWIAEYAVAKAFPTIRDPPPHLQAADVHLHYLDIFNEIAPYIIPQISAMLRPTLWHNNLDFENILLCPDHLGIGEIKILAISNWTHASVAPLYLQAAIPTFTRYHTPSRVPVGLQQINDINGFETMSQEEKAVVIADADLLNRHKFYEIECSEAMPDYYHMLSIPTLTIFIEMIKFAGKTWDKNSLIPLRNQLISFTDNWSTFRPDNETPCPVNFPDYERVANEQDMKTWQETTTTLRHLEAELGVSEDGWVVPPMYEFAIQKNIAIILDALKHIPDDDMFEERKMELLASWPFQSILSESDIENWERKREGSTSRGEGEDEKTEKN